MRKDTFKSFEESNKHMYEADNGNALKMKEKKNKPKQIIEYVKDEFTGWKLWEVGWLIIACGIICGLSIYWQDTLMGIISATTGVACVVCTGKGPRFYYFKNRRKY